MLLNLTELKNKYSLDIKGVLHIGAHFGEEYHSYITNGVDKLTFFEPVPNTFNTLRSMLEGKATLVNTALGSIKGKIEMNIETANQGQSSSILKPALHLTQYPHIKFEDTIEVDITTLDDYMESNQLVGEYNMINIDVQGYELEVFKGAIETLKYIDYIITEVNRDVVYHNCALIEELDSFLLQYNLQRVETTWDGGTWGDALYIKTK